MAETTSTSKGSADTAKAAPSPAKAEPKAEAQGAKAKTAEAQTAEAKPAPAAEKAPVKKAAAAKKSSAAAKKPAAKKAPAKKVAAKKTPARKSVAKKSPAKKPAKAPIAASVEADDNQPSVSQLKEKIMATKTNDYTAPITDMMSGAVNEMQNRTQAAYEKSTEAMSEMTDFAKGNVEAVVESGKVLAEGMQGMGQTFADEAKTAYETTTADIQEMASVKSPTELFQLQGKIMRRNFDAMIAAATKNSDATMKLANDFVAPMSARVSIASEKMSKVA
ncbi:phasin family protein [Aurantiacibacter rhizosphaerae]|uniref:Phasin family protein n=1 Tax=Aurantiacibacter rhizosphaerae TaxID=2691582 RepID=A0A844XBI3_9SPHN|nr:phasin family protein [Aurantiacibacter rhizosphaerae]MWV27200.1 phasin family protein [Aurantiacibacter rhizosphaerae]